MKGSANLSWKTCSDDVQGSPGPAHSPPHLLLRASCWARFSYIMRMARQGISEIKNRDLEISLFYRYVCQGPEKPGNRRARRPISSQACPRASTPCSPCRRRQGPRLSQQAVVRPRPGSNHCRFSKSFQRYSPTTFFFGQENPKRPP